MSTLVCVSCPLVCTGTPSARCIRSCRRPTPSMCTGCGQDAHPSARYSTCARHISECRGIHKLTNTHTHTHTHTHICSRSACADILSSATSPSESCTPSCCLLSTPMRPTCVCVCVLRYADAPSWYGLPLSPSDHPNLYEYAKHPVVNTTQPLMLLSMDLGPALVRHAHTQTHTDTHTYTGALRCCKSKWHVDRPHDTS